MTAIITHRGLDPSRHDYYVESSVEAFADQLKRGYGLEFDLQLTRDGEIVISHDSNLERISRRGIKSRIVDLDLRQIEMMEFGGCHLVGLNRLLELIQKIGSGAISAIHLKHNSQVPALLDKLVEKLKGIKKENFIIFDVKPNIARYLLKRERGLHLAASVAHPYDIQRYNGVVGGTLISVEEAIRLRELFDWVWLDEWDRSDINGGKKSLYNQRVFDKLRECGLKIALVSPELHGTSPGLLGGEAHQDAASKITLLKRMNEIIKLKPSLVCTDYPDWYQEILC